MDTQAERLMERLLEPWDQQQSRRVAVEQQAADKIASLLARVDELTEDKKNLAIELSIATGRQRVSIVDQDGNEVGHSFRSMKELTTEEAHVDEFGTVWTKPTAWAYFAACRALKASRDSAGSPEQREVQGTARSLLPDAGEGG